MTDFWNARYGQADFAYGREPNEFLKECLDGIEPGLLLLPAEGEGRNAVYAAGLGWDVVAYDPSIEGMRKAQQLAAERDLAIDYRLVGHADFHAESGAFDAVALIYAHVPGPMQRVLHRKMLDLLKPGGLLILEAFSKQQIGRDSGGPKDLDMLYSKAELEEDFQGMSELAVEECEVVLAEGPYHEGTAAVARIIGKK